MGFFVVLLLLAFLAWLAFTQVGGRQQVSVSTGHSVDESRQIVAASFGLAWSQADGPGQENFRPRLRAHAPVLSIDYESAEGGGSTVDMWCSNFKTTYGLMIHAQLMWRKKRAVARALNPPAVTSPPIPAGVSRPVEGGSGQRAASPVLEFDPQGPERALGEARRAIARGDYPAAFERSLKAVDRLHDFYVFEQFRNRVPAPADDPIVGCLTESLGRLRQQQPYCDVREGVVEATHRLRTISTAVDSAGGDSARYRRGLDMLARLAPDVDVSEVFWS
jgi:hypothetical protein